MRGRIFGIETEFGCLTPSNHLIGSPESVAHRIKDNIFQKQRLGLLDMHHRDWGEPPGNGGFLFNGGRLYIDMGHLEYATPECRGLFDLIAHDKAIEWVLQKSLVEEGIREQVSFIKNNIDHSTDATFGCHENYLVKRRIPFYETLVPELLPFLVTRQIFAGAGRVGGYDELLFDFDDDEHEEPSFVGYQISQRADHIITETYEWIQFSRAIINSRDEPLADYSKYRRLHLLIGDSNMSEYAAALKVGTTNLVLDLIETGHHPAHLRLFDPVSAVKRISRDQTFKWVVRRASHRTISAIDLQREYLARAQRYLKGKDKESNWVLTEWESVLDALERDPMILKDRIDWVAKKWLLETFMDAEKLTWDDRWLESLDLEYHNVDKEKGLYYELEQKGMMQRIVNDKRIKNAIFAPPQNTRAKARARLMRKLHEYKIPCIIDWDAVHHIQGTPLNIIDPFKTYDKEVTSSINSLSKISAEPVRPYRRRRRRV